MGFHIIESQHSHAAVWDLLQNSRDLDLESAGSQLASLYSYRIKADYRLDDSRAENKMNVTGHVEQAMRIIRVIEARCAGPNREHVIRAIKEYNKGSPNPDA